MPTDKRRLSVIDTPALDILARDHTAAGITAALEEYARLVEQAAASVEGMFSQAEWNLIADAVNGSFDFYDRNGNGADAHTILQSEVHESHWINRAGDKWLKNTSNQIDKHVEEMCEILANLSPLEAVAVMSACRFFWMHDLSHTRREWWTMAFRRKFLEVPEADTPEVVEK